VFLRRCCVTLVGKNNIPFLLNWVAQGRQEETEFYQAAKQLIHVWWFLHLLHFCFQKKV
jgi:hypothetical protein